MSSALRLDDARDHVLLDDRVAARAEAGAEEQLRDVLAAAAHAVQEVRRLCRRARRRASARPRRSSRTRRRACRRCCRTRVRPRPCRPACAMPEPLKMTSAIESPRRCLAEISPITQRTASMMFDLPQPFGPTTPTRLRREADRRRVHERLETGQLDLGQAHRFTRGEGARGRSAKCKRIGLASQHFRTRPRAGRASGPRRPLFRNGWTGALPVCIIPRPSTGVPGVRRCP